MVITAARGGDLLVLGRLLAEDATAAHARGWMGETPLHAAAAAGSAGAVRMLLDAGAEARARRDNGDTPLHRAGTGEIAGLLSGAIRDATPDQHNEHGQTPLHCARDHEVTAVLLRCGASPGARDHRGATPLHHAGPAKARVLLNAGADIGARDSRGQTPLHHAVGDGDIELTVLLLAEGADPVARDHSGTSPRHLAGVRGPQRIRDLLAEAPGSLAEPVGPANVAGSRQSALRRGRDGRVAVSVAGHAILVRWRLDREPRPEVIVATEHSAIRDVAVHPRLPLIAVAPVNAPVELRGDDLAGPEPLPALMDVTALAFSPDGRWLAAATYPERVVLFDMDTRQITADVGAGERTDCVDFSPDGSLLATTCGFQGGAHVRVDRITTGGGFEPITEIDRPAVDTIPAAVFTPDGRHLVIWATSGVHHERRAAGWRGEVLLSDTTGSVIWKRAIDADTTGVPAPLAAVGASGGWHTKPCVTPDGDRIALGVDGAVVLLSTGDGSPLAVLPLDGAVNAAAVDPVTGTLLLATDRGLRETGAYPDTARDPGRHPGR